MRLAIALGALALLLGGTWTGPAARADEKDAAGEGVWVFDVRVVRVDSPRPEVAEQPLPFPELTATTLRVPWTELLARLKKRGAARLLLDQRLTTMDGIKGTLTNERATPVLAVSTEAQGNAQYRAQIVKTGVTFEATPTATSVHYGLEIRDVARPLTGRDAPPQISIQWRGLHPALAGDTLVFHHREQVQAVGEAPARSVEHYAFVTGRFVPSR